MPNPPTPLSEISLNPSVDVDERKPPTGSDILNRLDNASNNDIKLITQALKIANRRISNLENQLRETSPTLKYLSIDSADIVNLTVGSEFGPGDFKVLSGPPDYDQIGWIGTYDTGVTVTVTSSTATTWTFATPHGMSVGDRFYVTGSSNSDHNGYHKVATVPTTTTLTLVSPVSGSGTGGLATLVLSGAHLEQVWIGGTVGDVTTAKLYTDNNGNLHINDAIINIAAEYAAGVNSEVTISPASFQILSHQGTVTWTTLFTDQALTFLKADTTTPSFNSSLAIANNGIGYYTAESSSVGNYILFDWSSPTGNKLTLGTYNPSTSTKTPKVTIEAKTGNITISGALTVSGAFVFGDPATTRTNLNVYSKSEVDALLLGKANATHSHSTITISGTAGGGVASHTHSGTVS